LSCIRYISDVHNHTALRSATRYLVRLYVLPTFIRLFRQASHPFACFGTPTIMLSYSMYIFKQRGVHRRRLISLLVTFLEDAVGPHASMVRMWSNTSALTQCGAILCRVSAVAIRTYLILLSPALALACTVHYQ
jgi:hypothetical protein